MGLAIHTFGYNLRGTGVPGLLNHTKWKSLLNNYMYVPTEYAEYILRICRARYEGRVRSTNAECLMLPLDNGKGRVERERRIPTWQHPSLAFPFMLRLLRTCYSANFHDSLYSFIPCLPRGCGEVQATISLC